MDNICILMFKKMHKGNKLLRIYPIIRINNF